MDRQTGASLDIYDSAMKPDYGKDAKEYADQINELITIEKVPAGRTKYGQVPVNPKAAELNNVVLIGCEVGVNGSELHKLSLIGERLYMSKGIKSLFGTLDIVSAHLARRLVEVGMKEGLVTSETAIGITGRAGITGNKPNLILDGIAKLCLYDEPDRNVVFVDDGLARGAAVMARCMNSMGTPKNPLGGLRHGKCILKQRMDYELKSGRPPISQGIRHPEKPQEYYKGGQP